MSMADEASDAFSQFEFMRQDEGDDSLFYRQPRLVVHIDDQAIAAVGRLLEEFFPPNSVILDLMSSWRSHWPAGHPKAHMTGLGLNAVEMQENPDLDDYVLHDLNVEPRLPFEDNSFDAVVISVSIQYLVRPVEVFREVGRVLRAGSPFLVIFSNRMFFTKAVRIWTVTNDEQKMDLVASYFRYAGVFGDIVGTGRNPDRGPSDDPVYVVIGRSLLSSGETPLGD